ARRYLTRTISTFILHGNVRDLQPVRENGRTRFLSLRRFLTDELFSERDLTVVYDRSKGIRGDTRGQHEDLLRAVAAYDTMQGSSFASTLPRDPARALQLLENYLRLRTGEGRRIAVLIDYAETVAPAGSVGGMGAEDRFSLVTLLRWAHDPQFLGSDLSICLIVENLAEISSRLARSPYVATIEVPLPGMEERLSYLETEVGARRRAADGRRSLEVSSHAAARETLDDIGGRGLTLQALAKGTAGLGRVHLGRLVTEMVDHGVKLSPEVLRSRKRDLIQAEAHGLLEVVEPAHDLDAVAGHDAVKRRLRDACKALAAGKLEVLPMGYLVAGPVGTGKTFMTQCFAGEVGIPCVTLKNFRSQWQGVTEANLEKIMTLLKAMWPVAVIVDEADAFLGDRGATGDSGVSQRVFAALAAFMGDTRWRGKIIWFLLTCRPDLLPVDLKRQGRAEEHLALFHPAGPEEVDALFKAMLKKSKATSELDAVSDLLPEDVRPSGADLEAMVTRARFRAEVDGRDRIERCDLEAVAADFLPPAYPLEIELQTLVAVQECTSRELLPAAYKEMAREEVAARIRALRALAG
ncbi:MAG: ATP-binding protein, partial [Myxococcota bacterium]